MVCEGRLKVDLFTILAVVVLAAVLIGEAGTYLVHVNQYDSDVDWVGSGIDYSVYSNGSDGYRIIGMTGSASPEEIFIFRDIDFDNHLSNAREKSEVLGFNQDHIITQLKHQLGIRGVSNVTISDKEALFEFVNTTSANPQGKAIVVIGYELPSSVYTGTAYDLLLTWINNGGRLYWAASEIGRFYYDSSGIHEVSDNQELFLGASGVVNHRSHKATDTDPSFCRGLSLINNEMNYAVSSSVPNSLAIGYLSEGYASVILVGHGAGEVCVFSGNLGLNQCDDMAQVIASGITSHTVLTDAQSGDVRGTISMHFDTTCDSAYVYIGGVNTVYGRAYHA